MSEENTSLEPIEAMSEEVADAEFERFCELWDIYIEEDSMDEEDLESFSKAKRPLIRGFKAGFITLDESGILSIKLRFSSNSKIETVKLDPSRANTLATDKYKDRESMHKMHAYVATMAKLAIKDFANIDERDKKVIRAPVILFLA